MASSSLQKIVKVTRKEGFQPCNCGDPTEEEIAETYRDAYEIVTAHIDKDIFKNCATIGADYRVRCWQATASPVKLEKVDKKTVLFCSPFLKVDSA